MRHIGLPMESCRIPLSLSEIDGTELVRRHPLRAIYLEVSLDVLIRGLAIRLLLFSLSITR